MGAWLVPSVGQAEEGVGPCVAAARLCAATAEPRA